MLTEQFFYGRGKSVRVPYYVHPIFRSGSTFDQYFFDQMKQGYFPLLSDDNIICDHSHNLGRPCILSYLKEKDCVIVSVTMEQPTIVRFVYDYEYFTFELVELGTILVKTDSLKDASEKMITLSRLFSKQNIDGIVGEENYIRMFYETEMDYSHLEVNNKQYEKTQ